MMSPVWAQEGRLEISSDPPGALVVVDHLVRGHAPLSVEGLAPGAHELRVSHGEDYRPYQADIQMKEGESQQCQVQLLPRSSTSLKIGVRLYKEGRKDLAAGYLQRAVTDTPVQPQAYYWLGLLSKDAGDDAKALEHFRNFAQYFPDSTEVHLQLAELHRREGDLSSALTSYKLALLTNKSFEGALDSVGPATWEKIKAAGEPTEPVNQLKLAYLWELKGRIPEAVRWAQSAAFDAFPEFQVTPYIHEGVTEAGPGQSNAGQ